MTGEEVLALKMPENDADATTVREYFKALLTALWDEGESFSGKRPLGNSGWEFDLLEAIPGKLSDKKKSDLLFKAIEAL